MPIYLTESEQTPQPQHGERQPAPRVLARLQRAIQRDAEIVIWQNRLGIWAPPLVKGTR